MGSGFNYIQQKQLKNILKDLEEKKIKLLISANSPHVCMLPFFLN